MGANSKIEWTDHTFNAWIGCTRVSAACDHCYAEALAHRHGWAEWGNHPRRRTGESNWKQPLKWNREAAESGTRARVFCASLADVFDNQVPDEWRDALWDLIAATPSLDWLLLTKRPQNIPSMMPTLQRYETGNAWKRENVWLGTTVENQQEAGRRIPQLLSVPAKVHFLSCEPLLGPIDLTQWLDALHGGGRVPIDWVICGGESGPHARPMHPDWARSLRDQCTAVGVAFHFKQWGEWLPALEKARGQWRPITPSEADERLQLWPDGELSLRIGKKAAGRVLDGREHNDFPAFTVHKQNIDDFLRHRGAV